MLVYISIPVLLTLLFCFAETLKEGRSKVRDAKSDTVLVVGQEFINGVKIEGVTAMLKQVDSNNTLE